jgi:type II secretory pathway pseudopilin PulG
MKYFDGKGSRKRGLTLIELIISIGICGLILADMTLIIVFTGKNLRKMNNESEALKNVSFILETLRYTLSMADYTTVTISDEGHRIEFQDPNLGGIDSSFEFQAGNLWYDRDESDGYQEKRGGRLINMTFEPGSAPNMIHVEIVSHGRNGEILGQPIRSSADIYLRNN